MRVLLLFLFVLSVPIGCSTTLDAPEVSGRLAKKEELRQKQMASDLKKKRESYLYRIKLSLNPGVNQLCPHLNSSDKRCNYPVILVEDDNLNASADGKRAYIHTGMIRFTESDEELAFIVAHEIAHNMLAHIDKKRANAALGTIADLALAITLGVNTQGAFGDAGSKAYSQAFEAESDYLALYLLANSGYDITNTPDFWRRMGIEHPDSISSRYNSTHPSTPERFVAMEVAVSEIEKKQNSGKQLIPKFEDDPDQEVLEASKNGDVSGNVASITEMSRISASSQKYPNQRITQRKGDIITVKPGTMRYTVEKLAMENGCSGSNGRRPATELLEMSSIQERYMVTCDNGNQITVSCRYQQCQMVDSNQSN